MLYTCSHNSSDYSVMATKTLEARFEHLTVTDENEAPISTALKSKVEHSNFYQDHY